MTITYGRWIHNIVDRRRTRSESFFASVIYSVSNANTETKNFNVLFTGDSIGREDTRLTSTDRDNAKTIVAYTEIRLFPRCTEMADDSSFRDNDVPVFGKNSPNRIAIRSADSVFTRFTFTCFEKLIPFGSLWPRGVVKPRRVVTRDSRERKTRSRLLSAVYFNLVSRR